MALWRTARARAAMVGPVLVAAMLSRSCWFQARTTLSPPVAAPAGARPARTAVNPTLQTRSRIRRIGSLRAVMAEPPRTWCGPETRPDQRGQGEAVEPADSSPAAVGGKIDGAAEPT